ncbi:MAG: glycosyltransferase family 87 protein [Planctomycetota bacterium]|jgi:hypothetical protein
MSTDKQEAGWSLPYCSPLPADPRKRRLAKIFRVAAYLLAGAALIVPVVHFQSRLQEQLREAEEFDRRLAEGAVEPGEQRPAPHKGAITRWREATYHFWAGKNIYSLPPAPPAKTQEQDAPRRPGEDRPQLHPNMPFTVIALSPLAYLPTPAEAVTFNLLKLAAVVASLLMAASVVRDKASLPADWVLALGFVWSARMIIGDLQHANTNCFVLAGVVFHMWLYRRGRDYLAGVPLAAAICLKLTPALFLLYWLYQRNWKLLTAAVAALIVMMVVVPVIALGPGKYAEFTGTWANNIIMPGLIGHKWFPTHVNQSLNGVAARYFLTGRSGNMNWDPDHDPHYVKTPEERITFLALPEPMVKMIVRALLLAIVVIIAAAIGFRKLPRDDGRRAIHFGLVLLGMMLLNQRTWDHHAAVLLVATMAAWHAVVYGKVSKRVRAWALGLMVAAFCCIMLKSADLMLLAARIVGQPERVGKDWGDLVEALGPTFYYFVLMFAALAVLAFALRREREPYNKAATTAG